VDRHDVRVIEIATVRLRAVALRVFRAGHQRSMGHFDRDGTRQFVVVAQIHADESASAEHILDAIAADSRGRRPRKLPKHAENVVLAIGKRIRYRQIGETPAWKFSAPVRWPATRETREIGDLGRRRQESRSRSIRHSAGRAQRLHTRLNSGELLVRRAA